MASRFSRIRFGVAVVTAFVFGLLFASGLDLTRFGVAQEGKGGKVASSQVQSLAETGSAFEAIADHVTPAVVSIQAERRRVHPAYDQTCFHSASTIRLHRVR